VLILSALFLFANSMKSGFSVLMGGAAYCIPHLGFVWLTFRWTQASQTMQFIAAFFVGEMMKLFLSATLVVIIVKSLPVSLLSVLIGYIGAIVSFWIVCMWYFSKPIQTV